MKRNPAVCAIVAFFSFLAASSLPALCAQGAPYRLTLGEAIRKGMEANVSVLVAGTLTNANTIRIDNSFLTVRLVPGKSPLRVIPCSMADIPLDANVLGPDAPTAIAVCEAAPKDRVEAIRKKGAHIIVAGKTHVDLPLLLRILKEKFGVQVPADGGDHARYGRRRVRLHVAVRPPLPRRRAPFADDAGADPAGIFAESV